MALWKKKKSGQANPDEMSSQANLAGENLNTQVNQDGHAAGARQKEKAIQISQSDEAGQASKAAQDNQGEEISQDSQADKAAQNSSMAVQAGPDEGMEEAAEEEISENPDDTEERQEEYDTAEADRLERMKERMRARRLRFVCSVLTIFLLGLGVRLYYIQVIDQEKYLEVASRQQQIILEGIDKRGTIYDRNGQPLTGSSEEYLYIIAKERLDDHAQELLAAVEARKTNSHNRRYDVYTTAKYDKEVTAALAKEYKAFTMRTNQRYTEDQPAVHIVGYVSAMDGIGLMGIEKELDHILSRNDKVYYSVGDRRGYIIPGMGILKRVESEEMGVITTLDLTIQTIVEQALENAQADGAVVILEAATGDVLASASAPVFDPNNVIGYLGSNNKELMNKATQGQYPPGSIFKIVVAAAGLELGVCDEDTLFYCEGYHEINGVQIRCSTGGAEGHGEITLRDAFARSCNSAFIQLGEEVGGEEILRMARILGFGGKTLSDFSEEKRGNLPAPENTAGAGIGNLSIGQGELLATPIQAAQMMQIIANDGIYKKLTLVQGTIEEGDTTLVGASRYMRVLSAKTTLTLQDMMKDTVETGTANNLNTGLNPGDDLYVSAAGKTGSAETSENGIPVVHTWFTGYFPAEDPQYAISVLIERGVSGKVTAVPVFQEIARRMKAEGLF